jgi:rubrerythrin
MADDELKKLYAQQSLIATQIKEKKREQAKEAGRIVDSLADLVCGKHPDAIFRVIGTIPESFIFSREIGGLNLYRCEPCGEDKDIFDKSAAYDCPNCEIVVGKFNKRHYRSSAESWENLAGREGEHYYCRECDAQLGSFYWKLS